MKNLTLNRNSRKQTHKTASLRKDILKTIIFSLPILALGASFIFAKTPNANADAASDIVVKITTHGTGYIKNVWNSTVNYTGTGTCPASGTLNAFERVDVSGCSVGDTMTVSEGTPGTSFRQWANNSTGQYAFFGSGTIRGEITQMPPMSSFTTDTTGTTAGNYFFAFFNNYGSLTSLPAGSFNTSKITTVGNGFFAYFNYSGALTQLPDGSFNTTAITTTGTNFFANFNANNGKLTKGNTGIPIKNVSLGSVNFQSWNGTSSDTTTIAAGDTFEFYGVNIWNYTLNPDNGSLSGGTSAGTGITDNTTITLPTSATRTGYTFAGFTSNAWTGTKNLGDTFTLTQDTGVVATWTRNQHTYTLNPDNGTLSGGTSAGSTDEDTLITLPTTATRQYYTFAGFTSNAWTGTKGLGATFIIQTDTEVVANWTKNADPTPDPNNPTDNNNSNNQTPGAPNTGSTNKLADATISGLILASIIAIITLFAKFAHKSLKSKR